MSNPDKHCCKLCGNETYEIFAYPHSIPEVIPFKIHENGKWKDVGLRICPKCGYVQGEVFEND